MLMIDGAVILLAGILIGRFLPARRPAKGEPGTPMCPCGHARSFHIKGTGACGWKRQERLFEFEAKKCSCKHYGGPEPLPDYYAPEIGGA